MKNAQKPDHISLNTLISRLRDGRYVIPDFQRDFEWKPWDIRDLIRSIFLDYYIGSLLLWKGKAGNFDALSCEHVYGFNDQEFASHETVGSPEYIVLDGQQRLTALHYALFSPDVNLPSRSNRATYFVRVDEFMAEQYDQAFDYEWHTRKFSKILADPQLQYKHHIFPLPILSQDGRAALKWSMGYEAYWTAEAQRAEDLGDEDRALRAKAHIENSGAFDSFLQSLTDQFQVSYIELDEDIGIDKVCDIFTQINSKGVQLDVFDLINALLKPKDVQLKHMWRQASERLDFAESDKMNVYVLQVMSILKQAYCSPKYLYFLLPNQKKPVRDPDGTRREEILIADTSEFTSLWNQAVDALEKAIEMLRHPQEFGVIAARYIPYVSILPAFAAMQAYVKTCPADIRLTAQRKIRLWYWASVFLKRYSGSVESTSARDFLDMKRWIDNDSAEPTLIGEFKTRFRSLDLRNEKKRGSSVYNGIFNLLVIQGARDWITGGVAREDDLDDHHIVPQSWGKKNLAPKAVDTILNRTPLSADTNRNIIRDRLPNAYLPEWIEKNGENEVRLILESHYISPTAFDILMRSDFGPDDYEAFISERQRTIQAAIEDLLIKQRLDLAPDLRDLDAEIEHIELALRKLIENKIGQDWQSVPQHVQQKTADRIQAAAKRNAAFDSEYYQSVSGQLEYTDMRELQDIITSKLLWPKFQDTFVQKEALNTKFGQLAGLRNSIRHSRAADEITTMEGGAAIKWFKKVMSLDD